MRSRRMIFQAFVFCVLAVGSLISTGCGYSRCEYGRPFEAITSQVGRTTRADVLAAMGPPQLYDYTRAGEVGSNFLVYEYRKSKTWLFSFIPVITLVNYLGNTEDTKTMAFYFNAGGILTAVGLSENEPTTSRHGFSLLLLRPWSLDTVMK